MSSFNHYARLKKILAAEPAGWYIVRIDQPTTTKKFNGELSHYDHYYRLYTADGQPIRYGKFQQLSRFAQVMSVDQSELVIVDRLHLS